MKDRKTDVADFFVCLTGVGVVLTSRQTNRCGRYTDIAVSANVSQSLPMKRFREFLCRRWGHTIDAIDGACFVILAWCLETEPELDALGLDPELECTRCGKVLWKRVDGEWIGMA